MGNEALCRIELDGESAEAKVLLETEELIVRGAVKLRVPFRDVQRVEASDGVLHLNFQQRELRLHVGRDAAKWAEKIRNPKSVADKLGIKAGQKISIAGELDATFVDDLINDLSKRGAEVSRRLRKASDVIFFAASHRDDLAKLHKVRESLAPAGALWVIRPKGASTISESEVMAAGKAAGLVDVKVVRFSDTHTAEKFVIPLAKRA
ncbi:MAG TPA: hypothetical protein VF824_13230 [Thermoanaerobaculia bacterium]|jgi:hypothetical protein